MALIYFLEMILIFSNSFDLSINQIIKLLLNSNIQVLRINENDRVEYHIDIKKPENSIFEYQGTKFSISQINSIWFRKGAYFQNESKNLADYKFFNDETNIFIDYLEFIFDKKIVLNYPKQRNFNKLKMLTQAGNFGISCPKSFIITRNDFLKTHTDNNSYIAKPIKDVPDKRTGVSMWTRLLTKDDHKDIPNTFFPSLIQSYIKTDYEIRGVYIHKKFYCCSLSNKNKSATEVDFRSTSEYDLGLQPISLPNILEKNLNNYFEYLKMEFCSFDLLVHDNEFYLIDINPFGSFGFVTKYFDNEVEKYISEYLITREKKFYEKETERIN